MVVLPIVLALAVTQCEASLQPVVLALQENDVARASALLTSSSGECSESAAFFGLTGVADELSGKADDAETAFLKAISLDPKSARLKEQLGAAYLRNKKPAQAAEILRAAVMLDPTSAVTKKYLIGAYVETNSWSDAAALFDKLGEKISRASDPVLVLWFARTLIETKQLARLDRDLPSPSPTMPGVLLFSLGTLFAEHGMYQKAINYLCQIPEKDADDAAYFNLGLAFSHLHKYDDARKNYFLAIDKQPDHAGAYFRVGLDYGGAGDSRRALPWLFRAQQLAPQRAEVSYALVEQLILLGYRDTAQEILTQADRAIRADPLLSVAAADLKQAKGDPDGALDGYRNALAQQPGFPPALIGLARANVARGKDAEARSSLDAVLSKNPDDAAANGELGSIEARQGNWHSALQHLHRAWTQDKSNTTIALELSRVNRRLNSPAEALKILTPIEPVMRHSSEYHLELAQVYSQLQQSSQADAERKTVAQLQADAHEGLHFDAPQTYIHDVYAQ